jgi:putative DNA primase/helicase
MFDFGCRIFPVVERGKKPAIKAWQTKATKNRKVMLEYFRRHPDENYGVLLGGKSDVFVVDFDGSEGKSSFKKLKAVHGPLPATLTVETPRGRHYYFRAPAGFRVRNSVGRIAKGVDIRGEGGYVVGAGSVHPSGEIYSFKSGRGPDEVDIAPAPTWLLREIKKSSPLSERLGAPEDIPPAKRPRALAYAEAARQRELDRLERAPKHQRNDTLNICAFRLGQLVPYGLLDPTAIGEDLAKIATATGLSQAEIGRTIASGLKAGHQNPRPLPFFKGSKRRQVRTVDPVKKSSDEVSKQLAALGESDTDNAQRFATRFGDRVLYTVGRGWLIFDGKRWRPDAQLQCMELAKKAARLIRDEAKYLNDERDAAGRAKFAAASLSKGALDRMLDLAKGLLLVEDSKLDADPWLYNTATGTIDLRTGHRAKHDPRDLLTKMTPVAADPRAKCPVFMKFLNRITGGDVDLMTYIQKCVGYSLSGITSEQVLFSIYGAKGNNGKSTFLNLIREMLGDYGCHTPTETLVTKQYDNAIPADLARLNGARMVTAIEANFNRALDEARIKAMTGGEPITARFLYGNYFEFTPEFKLWVAANDRPRVRGTDDALWRRIRVIPFDVEIPASERDPGLRAKLTEEWPGILAWAVRGCLKWRREGLDEPQAVKRATDDWRKAADHIARFAQEALTFHPDGVVSASTLHGHYKAWCVRNGENPLSMRDLKSKLMVSLDVTHKRTKRGSEWYGLKLRT